MLPPVNRKFKLRHYRQFNRLETGEGMVQVFRRDNSFYEAARFKLRALEADARYGVTNLDAPDRRQEFSGRELMEQGLRVEFRERPAAAVMTYQKSGQAN